MLLQIKSFRGIFLQIRINFAYIALESSPGDVCRQSPFSVGWRCGKRGTVRLAAVFLRAAVRLRLKIAFMFEESMFWEFTLRLAAASVLGALIGIDRTYRAKDAGFRTHILVCLGSALMMIVSQYGFSDVVNGTTVRLDPSRIAAQVVSGIGFIGAGTIIFRKQIVRGLTTAAGLWATAGIGLAIGCGMFATGIVATILTLVGLEVISLIFKNVGIHTLLLQFSTGNKESIKAVSAEIARMNGHVVSYEAQTVGEGETILYRISILVRALNAKNESEIIRYIQQMPDIMVEKID